MKWLLLFALTTVAFARDEDKDTIRCYQGTIGKDLAVSLILSTRAGDSGEDRYSGSYQYRKTGVPISLTAQESRSGALIFHENEHRSGGEDAFTGKWEVKVGDDTITGTWSSPDGKKSMPIQLKEGYPAGSFRAEISRFESSWTRKRDRTEVGMEKSVSLIQFQGGAPGIAAINTALRKSAWESAMGVDYDMNTSNTPAEISTDVIEKAVTATPPKEIDWTTDYRESHSMNMDLVMNESGMICVSLVFYEYTGGAHGNHGISYLTFDSETGKQVQLADLVAPGFEKHWAELGAAEIRSQHGKKPGSPLTESGLFEDKLELNGTWFLTPGGIGFSYDPYEIASYAEGLVEFTLPWKSIARDLKPGTRVEGIAKGVLEKAK